MDIQDEFPENCEDAIRIAETLVIPKRVKISDKISIKYGKPEKIIVAGMGGSAIGGNILKDWLRETVSSSNRSLQRLSSSSICR